MRHSQHGRRSRRNSSQEKFNLISSVQIRKSGEVRKLIALGELVPYLKTRGPGARVGKKAVCSRVERQIPIVPLRRIVLILRTDSAVVTVAAHRINGGCVRRRIQRT